MIDNNLPKILTVKEWEAKKGVVAKLAGETGMGAALKKLDAAWSKIPWDLLDPTTAWNKHGAVGKPPTVAGLKALLPAAKGAIGKVEPARKELVAVRDLAAQLEKKWKASKVIPSSSTKYAGEMAKTADQLFIALKSIDNEWKNELELTAKKEARVQAMALQVIKPYFQSLRQFGSAVQATPTVAAYLGEAKTGFHQNIRGLNAALERSGNPQWMQWKETNWKPMAQDAFKPKTDSEVLPKVRQVLARLDDLQRLVG